MAEQAQKDGFVAALTVLGGSAGNGRLREALQWDEATYNAVKDELVAEGVVTPGRGRGGSVSLGGAVEGEAEEPAPVAARAKPARNNGNGGNLGFEADLFKAADKLRGNMEPSDYKHVALGLIFLKYISDAFEARHAQLLAEDPAAAEDKDEYLADNISPRSVVRTLVEMLEPYNGRVYDPCCGSGGMFVQSEKFVAEHGGAHRRHRHLRAGKQLHHLASGEDEPRRAQHRQRHPPEQVRELVAELCQLRA